MDERRIIDIGPECFADGDGEVISWKGDNFYKACGAMVSLLPEGGLSSCVKRVNHPGVLHEDYYGNLRSINA